MDQHGNTQADHQTSKTHRQIDNADRLRTLQERIDLQRYDRHQQRPTGRFEREQDNEAAGARFRYVAEQNRKVDASQNPAAPYCVWTAAPTIYLTPPISIVTFAIVKTHRINAKKNGQCRTINYFRRREKTSKQCWYIFRKVPSRSIGSRGCW